MKKRKLIILITLFSLLSLSAGAELYRVKPNDYLIKIIKSNFPNLKVFGKDGMLKKLLALNPNIKNPDLIFIDQKILLSDELQTTKMQSTMASQGVLDNPVSPIERAVSSDQNLKDEWIVKVLYGANINSLEQSKTFSGFSLSTLSSNLLKCESEFKYDDYKIIGNFESDSFSIASDTSTYKTKLSRFDLQGVINHYLFGFSYRESPLIKATTTSLELNKEGQFGLIAGYDKSWSLPTTKPTLINFRSSLFIPLKNNSDKANITFKSIKGLGLSSQLELSRTIIKKEAYSLDFVWQNGAVYEKTSRKTTWGTSNGEVDLAKIGVSSIIGFGVRF